MLCCTGLDIRVQTVLLVHVYVYNHSNVLAKTNI